MVAKKYRYIENIYGKKASWYYIVIDPGALCGFLTIY